MRRTIAWKMAVFAPGIVVVLAFFAAWQAAFSTINRFGPGHDWEAREYKENMNALAIEMRYLSGHYRWAITEYHNQLRAGASLQDLDKFRRAILLPVMERFAELVATTGQKFPARPAGKNPLRQTGPRRTRSDDTYDVIAARNAVNRLRSLHSA